MRIIWNLVKGLCTVTGFYVWGTAISNSRKKKRNTGLKGYDEL